MKLIITEKPSVAKSIVSALGVTFRADGCFEGNGLIVSWCVGHLVSPMDAAGYDPGYKKWRYDDLPVLPEPFRYVLVKDKEDAFQNLKRLMEREDVTELVNACDAGREGELIFRLVYEMAGCAKPFSRLWISSMEDAAIREGFANLRPGAEYDPLYQSALCRQKADWLIGINATRLFSVLYHRTLNVGRVQTPTLVMLVDRDWKITSFKKEKYHHVRLALDGAEAVSERITSLEEAEALRVACADDPAVCTAVTREQKKEAPPKFYDLTTLQREANRLFGYTAKQTLDYTQSLYEKKLLTYPRTDSRFLTADMAETAAAVLHLAVKEPPFDGCKEFFPDVSLLVNDGKVSDHHAIIPTLKLERQTPPSLWRGSPGWRGNWCRNIPTSPRRARSCSPRSARPWASAPAAASRSMRARRIFTALTAPASLSCGRMTVSGPPRKKELTKKMAGDLLKKGRTSVKGMWSEKKGSTYDAVVVLDDTGGKYVRFKLEFPKRKEGVNGR